MFFKSKPRFYLEFSSEVLSCDHNCFNCVKTCDLLKRKDIRFLHSRKSTGNTQWDNLLSCCVSDNVTITRAVIDYKQRIHKWYILEGWFKKGGYVYDFEIHFDTIKSSGFVNVVVG